MKAPAPLERIAEFGMHLRNASREGAYGELLLAMYQSGDWRRYKTLEGVDEWRAHEFDYFLIAREAHFRDVQRILGWKTEQAATVAAAMIGPDGKDRRPIATVPWRHTSGQSLAQMAEAGGWMRKESTRVARVVSSRVIARVQHQATNEALAQQARRHELGKQRPTLNARVKAILAETPDPTALRYIVDQLQRYLRGRRRSSHREQWRRDIQAARGDHAKLAVRWGTTPETTRQRIRRMRDISRREVSRQTARR